MFNSGSSALFEQYASDPQARMPSSFLADIYRALDTTFRPNLKTT
jgi:hypothetical protein